MHVDSAIHACESVALMGATDARVICGAEALTAAGYDPEVYLAVVPSAAMRGGKLNKNGRIYGPPADVAAKHMELVTRAREGCYVGSRQGHPREDAVEADNPQMPTDAAQILDGGVIAQADGSVDCTALVGVLNTSRGRDVYTMWRAGKPTGLSLRGLVTERDEAVTEATDYGRMNPGAVGQTVKLRQFVAPLDTYDVVFDPSFSTFFDAPPGMSATESVVTDADSAEVREAYARLRAAGAIVTPTGAAGQEHTMDIKDLVGLEAAFPELCKQLRADAAAAATAAATQTATEAAATAQSIANERISALEAVAATTKAKLDETLAALEASKAEAARKTLEAQIVAALEAWIVGKPGAGPVADKVKAAALAGKFLTAEEAVERATEGYDLAKAVMTAAGAAPVAPIAERAGIVPGKVDADADILGTEATAPRGQKTDSFLDL